MFKIGDIEGVIITPLKKIPDERGAVYHMLRSDSPLFKQFGEIYFSVIHPGVVKAWHLHKKMTLNYAVPSGKIKLVLYDARQDSGTRGNLMEIFLGTDNYSLVTIPPGVWNGFKGLGAADSIVANCATHSHEPDEIIRMDPVSDPISKEIGYDWTLKYK